MKYNVIIIINMFEQYANIVYIQTKREQFDSKVVIPNFIWIIMLFLGFNEIMWIFISTTLIYTIYDRIFHILYCLSSSWWNNKKFLKTIFNILLMYIKDSITNIALHTYKMNHKIN